ncbi:dipeptidyl-peptidase 4-related [Anaeramoeba flamelloides]|uniref:Dipeptidyl-peptidase 4-related n=1 Tax=Anaeramoeba flamelloides TaxID=1746091 RepID=A0ABQ8Y6F6_9EUKA|nr:dipeptidyl-peptidase 4-related [Anaeramoeba flamelloides]
MNFLEKKESLAKLFTHYDRSNKPRSPKWFQNKKGEDSLLFLGTNTKNKEKPDSNLFTLDLQSGEWNNQYEGSLTVKQTELSKEEILLKERMRASKSKTLGISKYILDDESGKVLYPIEGQLFQDNLNEDLENKDINKRLKEIPKVNDAARMHLTLSTDGHLVSFLRKRNIWVIDLATGEEHQLTTDGKSGYQPFVMQEEFDLYKSFWWSSFIEENENERIYSIVYLVTDESMCTKYPILNMKEHTFEVEEFLYPWEGTENAKQELRLVKFSIPKKKTNNFNIKETVQYLKPHTPLKTAFQDLEYIIQVGCHLDFCWLQFIDRSQKHLKMIRLEINEDFIEINNEKEQEKEKEKENEKEIKDLQKYPILVQVDTEYWINSTEIIYWFKNNRNKFLFATEETGFRHLYLYEIQESEEKKIQKVVCKAITAGDWIIYDTSKLFVDESKELVYYLANPESALEKHLCVSSFADGNDPNVFYMLTKQGFTHANIEMNKDRTLFFCSFSNIETDTEYSVFKIIQKESQMNKKFERPSVEKVVECYSTRQLKESFPGKINPPKMFTFESKTGETIHGCYYEPVNAKGPYKTILKIYNGPHVQYITNSRMMTISLRTQFLVLEGYCVVLIDGRGSWNRGLKFEGYHKLNMGGFELEDQIQGLQMLIDKGIVHKEKIVIYGWSYGGYMTAMALAKYPDFFSYGICGAPVTHWSIYDTGYTERYMSNSKLEKEVYEKSSVLKYVPNMKKDKARMFLIHGLIDENVHLTNSTRLIQCMYDNSVPFEFQLYPKERHGVGNYNSYCFLQASILNFLSKNL